ncbi:hypothetical protein AMS68_006736 [Peltaster fructicola]|uniref:RNA polymerase II subunit B1 CTD phosphatase RPAP2 homolog n=1 Tax=Peltaster fructicola TaxID=286661 RepID=A0A6H0Y2Y6_9PEZI|nr:hypothetical protein AMS68_006736 [Peltaster fructicola]
MESVVSARTLFEQSEKSTPNARDVQDEATSKHERNLKLAYQHALLIQHRKDVEAQILTSIETLSEIPRVSKSTLEEQRTFLKEVSLFQPSDYTDLVAERVTQSRCGYVLCGQKPRSRAWHLPSGSTDFCSNACQGKSEYIRLQLSPVPAWERSLPQQQVHIILSEQDGGIGRPSSLDPNAELAFERGEKQSSQKPAQVMEAVIVEKEVVSNARAMSCPDGSSINAIEGYVPKHEQDKPTEEDCNVHEPHQSLDEDPPDLTRGNAENSEDDEQQQWKDMFAHLQRG